MLLSYQIWQDEACLTAWRVNESHHHVQTVGGDKIFSDYRIRIAQVAYEAKPEREAWRPDRRSPYNDPDRRKPRVAIATESANAELAAKSGWQDESFRSVYREGRFAHLIDVPDEKAAMEFGPKLFADPTTEYFRVIETIRDYGMFERAEAPQYYPPASR
ncbi:hypothetical protein V1283_006553 [Bradyrhizobium sp. AZCC 2262]|uniref:antibiotic biosynthesis monooxygenase n=1 Tax=Bradyrhizobium sp. AZCC 2262 TaxID=3117022 RepID=UPI002FF34D69